MLLAQQNQCLESDECEWQENEGILNCVKLKHVASD